MLKDLISFKKVIQSFSRVITLVVFIALYPSIVLALDITLQWDENTEPDLVGYTIYWTELSICPTGISACNNPTGPYAHQQYIALNQDENPIVGVFEWTVSGLHPCIPWCFAVDAVDSQGLHSGFSNQIGLIYILNSVSGSKQ